MAQLPVTSILVALACLMMVGLSLPVSLRRRALKLASGFGDDAGLTRRSRAHGNFIEYAPLGLLATGLVELCGYVPAIVWTLGGALLLGRLLHAAGVYRDSVPLKAGGMILTHLAFLGAAGLLLAAWTA